MSLQEAPEKHEGSAGTGAPSQGMIFSAAARPDALSACIARVKSTIVTHVMATLRQNYTAAFVTILPVCKCSEVEC